jgi:hypothetical protein
MAETYLTCLTLERSRAIPRVLRAAPSNITVVPPSGTCCTPDTGGRGCRSALTFWLNASITAQKTAEKSASFVKEKMWCLFM